MAQALVHLKGGARGRFARADWQFEDGEQWGVIGEDGAAKAQFCALVAGRVPPSAGTTVEWAAGVEERVRLVSFAQQRDAASKRGYRQARYYSEVDEAGPGDTVEEVLAFNRVYDVNPFEVGVPRRAERKAYAAAYKRVVPLLNLKELLDRDFLALSNGETRRVLLAKALLANPRLLVLDDPCAGLDPDRRAQVKALCDALAADGGGEGTRRPTSVTCGGEGTRRPTSGTQGLSLLVAVRHADELPGCITDVLTVEKGRLSLGRAASPLAAAPTSAAPASAAPASAVRPTVFDSGAAAKPVVELRDIRIAFGRRKLFNGFSWTVREGERWVLRGANGSGKTTLLALLTGDSPLAYANDVTVFGLPRAPGVELARVRRRIGMVSPEQQSYEGRDAFELLEAALAQTPDLLLLDEPCLNLDTRAAARLKRRVAAWLTRHPACTAICVAHRPEDVPEGFNLECAL